jgi:type II secretory pathway pseudopilin PulG
MRSRYRGSLLIETLVGAALSIVAIALAVPILRWSSQGMHRDEESAESAAMFDHAIDMLRKDVWQATRITRHGVNMVQLISPTTGMTRWFFDSDGTIRRIAPGGRQSWSTTPGTTFTVDGAMLTVFIPASRGHQASTLAIVCPASLYAEAQP